MNQTNNIQDVNQANNRKLIETIAIGALIVTAIVLLLKPKGKSFQERAGAFFSTH